MLPITSEKIGPEIRGAVLAINSVMYGCYCPAAAVRLCVSLVHDLAIHLVYWVSSLTGTELLSLVLGRMHVIQISDDYAILRVVLATNRCACQVQVISRADSPAESSALRRNSCGSERPDEYPSNGRRVQQHGPQIATHGVPLYHVPGSLLLYEVPGTSRYWYSSRLA